VILTLNEAEVNVVCWALEGFRDRQKALASAALTEQDGKAAARHDAGERTADDLLKKIRKKFR
jgi:hypothetical protein